MEKSCKNVHQKLHPGPFLILINNPKQPLHARNSFKNKKDHYKKIFKTLTLFFLSNPVSFNAQEYEKQKRPGASD